MKEKLTYMGAGIGIVVFALFGLLPGSFIGGVLGLNILSQFSGAAVEPGIFERILVAISMLCGVLVSGLMFVAAGSILGWAVGSVVDSVVEAGKKIRSSRHSGGAHGAG